MRRFGQLGLFVLCAAMAGAESGLVRLEKVEKHIFELVNQERTDRGAPALKWSEKLASAATAHLRLMVEHKRLSHRFPGEFGLSDRLAVAGVRFNASAENVAFASGWEDLHPSLMRSVGHRANILNTKYDEIGIAVAQGPNGYYIVQNFAHVTSESSAADAESRFATGLRKALRRNIKVVPNPGIRQAVCKMAKRDQVEARRLPHEYPEQRMFAYTAFEPEDIPKSLLESRAMNSANRVVVGICYRATGKYPGGTYWVGVIY